MPSCCQHEIIPQLMVTDYYSYLLLLLNVLLTGVSGSFTHCIGMCGPIATNQVSMRLMDISPNQMHQSSKIKAIIALPYYCGKAMTYALFALLLAMTKVIAVGHLPEIIVLVGRITILMILATVLLIFAFLEAKKTFGVTNKLNNRFISQVLSYINFSLPNVAQKITNVKLRATGWQGLLLGMLLGLLPCGLVYNMLIIISGSNANILQATFAMFVFGLATMPGLVIFSSVGNLLLLRYRRLFSIFYILSLFANSMVLYYYAIK